MRSMWVREMTEEWLQRWLARLGRLAPTRLTMVKVPCSDTSWEPHRSTYTNDTVTYIHLLSLCMHVTALDQHCWNIMLLLFICHFIIFSLTVSQSTQFSRTGKSTPSHIRPYFDNLKRHRRATETEVQKEGTVGSLTTTPVGLVPLTQNA